MTIYAIEPSEATLQAHFSSELAPVLTIAPGDTVHFRTLDAGWGLEPPTVGMQPGTRKKWPRAVEEMRGHALCGPVAVRGAQPGMALVVRIDAVRPGDWGWQWAGGWPSPLNARLAVAEGEERLLAWTIDHAAGRARNQHGHSVALRPFMGILGVAPPEPGRHVTRPPRVWGGNLDCKELIAGSTLYLPVGVPGAHCCQKL